MSIANYTDLLASVASYMHRDDLTTTIPDFIRLAEARFNRDLRTTDMEETLSSTSLTNGEASLPTGFLAFKELRFDGDTEYTLQPKPLEWIRAQGDDSTGDARYFAVTKSSVVCHPRTGPIKGTYYKEIPALADNSTNWLLTAHPDLYLFAALTEAAIWGQDDANLPLWAERTKATLDAIQRKDDDNQFNGGVLAIRAR